VAARKEHEGLSQDNNRNEELWQPRKEGIENRNWTAKT